MNVTEFESGLIRAAKDRGWTIEHNPNFGPDFVNDWVFSHKDHNGENGLCGIAMSPLDAINQIAEIEDE